MIEGVLHRALGDLVEDYAFDVDIVEQAALAQQLFDMPGNRFAFAIRVGCQI